MAKTTKNGITERKYFTPQNTVLEVPDLVEHQKKSWQEFVETGLNEVFNEINPIDDYTGEKLSMSFKSYEFEDPKETEAEARDNNTSFLAPLYTMVELTNKTTGEVSEERIYMGDFPWMTERGTFIINGVERVIISQLIRSSGVVFSARREADDRNYYGAKIIPTRGAWLEFETSFNAKNKANNGVIYVKVDRKRKIPATALLKTFGYTIAAIREAFKDVDTGEVKFIEQTLGKDKASSTGEAIKEVFRAIRPGDQASVDDAKKMIERMFFDFRRFDLGRVGRYKFNQRLGQDLDDKQRQNRVFRPEDLVAVLAEIIRLNNSQGAADDIDAMYNRRIKLVGELVEHQYRIGLARLDKNIRDRMSMVEMATVTPKTLINARPVTAAVREFFATSQLSQFMDQANPLSELAHKRRLTTTGPGGLTRERAGFEVRDVHPTHYSRVCIIETPEGQNVGLVLNLATYARINEYGFAEAPYVKVEKGKVTGEVVYLDAAQEEKEVIAEAGTAVNEATGKFVEKRVSARRFMRPETVDAGEVTMMDASRMQLIGSTAALIPFIDKNRIDRNLTGANMQRQAVPLINPKSPIVGTGIEYDIAKNTSQLICARAAGEVVKAEADEVQIKYGPKEVISYYPEHFVKSNEDRSFNSRVVVSRGDKVKKGQPIIEGASVADGELAIGRDLIVAYMPWKGYNMDDGIVISRRLVEDDELTNINISSSMVEVRDTKLGPEIVTRDIPNAREEAMRHLDDEGIVRIGAEVKPGDILVGKITPKGEQELSSEERLLRAIFGEKAKDVRDTSHRVGNAAGGKIVGVKIFSKQNGHEMKSGVIKQIEIFIAETRKIQVGDKLAGRYGNKGVVARVLPVEDMPYLADGTPVDVVLNPMGVPSRMNLGQLFETHLGMAARLLGYKLATPPFDDAPAEKISEELVKAGLPADGKVQLFDGRTGEPFQEKVTVGNMYIIKLHHMVADKIHARSTGPYTMVTQQPLGGKAQNGGQRFGEMEVWALEAYGAASTLQEMITIKSDDVVGRSWAYESIIKDEQIQGPKIPEGFNVLVKELQGLGLRVDLISDNETIEAEEILTTKGETVSENDDEPDVSVIDENIEAEIADEFEDELEDNLEDEVEEDLDEEIEDEDLAVVEDDLDEDVEDEEFEEANVEDDGKEVA
ncbi:MAG: DNA-directed RNA polymerase subunit beta [Candidatus Nomurabacteria bacterium]|jgi:DNA-directed RNA polymerase subunit beta|nr:DNA-directed RNA polymerase subunit beta [Candidatus Nomurabacteria bacterium]